MVTSRRRGRHSLRRQSPEPSAPRGALLDRERPPALVLNSFLAMGCTNVLELGGAAANAHSAEMGSGTELACRVTTSGGRAVRLNQLDRRTGLGTVEWPVARAGFTALRV